MVVACLGLVLRPYHTPCYGEMEESVAYRWFTRSFPVNHGPGDFAAVAGLAGSLVIFVVVLSNTFNVGWALLDSFLWSAVLRLVSYLWFERPVVLCEPSGS